MRARVTATAILLTVLAFGMYVGAQEDSSVSVTIAFPPQGYITVSSEVEVRGTVHSESPVQMVIVSLNGIPKKVPLGSDGGFRALVELALQENLITAIAITENQEMGSDKVEVTRQNPVLFFDEFEGREPQPEWSPTSGEWVIESGTYSIEQYRWSGNAFTYVKTQDSLEWRDYAVEVDVVDADETRYGGVVVRAHDDLNKVVLHYLSDNWICWRIIKNGNWSDCVGRVSPGLSGKVRLRVEVAGNRYTAYVNGVKRTSMQDSSFSQGMPGLLIRHKYSVAFDNFTVQSLAPGTAKSAATGVPSASKEASQEETVEQPAVASKASEAQFQRLRERVAHLEPIVQSLQVQVGNYSIDLKGLSDRVDTLERTERELPSGITQQLSRIQNRLVSLEQLENQNSEQAAQLRDEWNELRNEVRQVKGSNELALLLGGAGVILSVIFAVVALR